jgi:hypothetical protein
MNRTQFLVIAANKGSKVRPTADDRLAPPQATNMYRCPACGAMVDNQDQAAVRLHHDHTMNRWLGGANNLELKEKNYARKESIENR